MSSALDLSGKALVMVEVTNNCCTGCVLDNIHIETGGYSSVTVELCSFFDCNRGNKSFIFKLVDYPAKEAVNA